MGNTMRSLCGSMEGTVSIERTRWRGSLLDLVGCSNGEYKYNAAYVAAS